jgi:hypothetical protein
MSLFEGRVNVLSANKPSTASLDQKLSEVSLDALDAPSNLRNIQGLFAASSVHEEGQQRAQKRRKIDHESVAPVVVGHAGEDSSILLARIALNLVSSCVALHRRFVESM